MLLFQRKKDIDMDNPEYKRIESIVKKQERNRLKNQHHRKLTKRQLSRFLFALIIFILLTIINIAISAITYLQKPREIKIETIKLRHITDMQINDEIEWHFLNGYTDIVYDWYTNYIGNRKNAIALINSALLHKIPLHKSIAQSWIESRHNENAIGYNYDKNGDIWSRDIGLKQGNEITFRNDLIEKMLDPEYNLSRCDAFFRVQYEKYKNWYRALIAYNRGNYLDERGIKYMQQILDYEKYLDAEFNLNFPIIEINPALPER